MIVLRIEHEVINFDGWKKAFDSDPIDRRKSGVKRHRVYRPTDGENFVTIDLEFENLAEAQATRLALQNLVTKVVGTLVLSPRIKLLNIVESKDY